MIYFQALFFMLLSYGAQASVVPKYSSSNDSKITTFEESDPSLPPSSQKQFGVDAGQSLRIAVIQVEQVLGEFRGKLKDQFSKYLDKYYKEFLAHEEKLRQEHRALLDEQKSLKKENKKAQEAWSEKMREFESRVMELQKIGEEKRHGLEQKYSQIMEKIYQELRQILKALAVEKNIQVFLTDQHAIHWDPTLDVTRIVHKRLKERIVEHDLMIKESSYD